MVYLPLMELRTKIPQALDLWTTRVRGIVDGKERFSDYGHKLDDRISPEYKLQIVGIEKERDIALARLEDSVGGEVREYIIREADRKLELLLRSEADITKMVEAKVKGTRTITFWDTAGISKSRFEKLSEKIKEEIKRLLNPTAIPYPLNVIDVNCTEFPGLQQIQYLGFLDGLNADNILFAKIALGLNSRRIFGEKFKAKYIPAIMPQNAERVSWIGQGKIGEKDFKREWASVYAGSNVDMTMFGGMWVDIFLDNT